MIDFLVIGSGIGPLMFGFSEQSDPWRGVGIWHPMPYIADNVAESRYEGLAGYFAGLPMGTTLTPNPPRGAATNPASMRIDDKPLPRYMRDVCSTCHGEKLTGSREGDIPNITLQSEPYLTQQLASFRMHHRPSSKMQLVTDQLSTDNVVGIARYLASFPPAASSAANNRLPSSVSLSAAAQLARHGDKSRNLPACLSCHESKAVKTVALIPPLDGQNPAYLASRLETWAESGEISRNDRNLGPMAGIARKLNKDEMRSLANYFAARDRQAKN